MEMWGLRFLDLLCLSIKSCGTTVDKEPSIPVQAWHQKNQKVKRGKQITFLTEYKIKPIPSVAPFIKSPTVMVPPFSLSETKSILFHNRTTWHNNRGYYMTAWRYKISLQVLKNISLVCCAHLWNIFSAREEKFNISQRPRHVLSII